MTDLIASSPAAHRPASPSSVAALTSNGQPDDVVIDDAAMDAADDVVGVASPESVGRLPAAALSAATEEARRPETEVDTRSNGRVDRSERGVVDVGRRAEDGVECLREEIVGRRVEDDADDDDDDDAKDEEHHQRREDEHVEGKEDDDGHRTSDGEHGVFELTTPYAPVDAAGQCKVCGDTATGMYFGVLVCVPCKTFFLRYTGDGAGFKCKKSGNCVMTVASRTQCKQCRYQRCLEVGMRRRLRPTHVQVGEGQLLCVVCGDIGNGVHFGAVTCEGCKKFFRRGLLEHATYKCKFDGNCVVNPRTRNACRYCRFQKCSEAGMSRGAIQMGRPSKVRLSGSSSLNSSTSDKSAADCAASSSSNVVDSATSPINLSFRRVPDSRPVAGSAGARRSGAAAAAQRPPQRKRKLSTADATPVQPDSTFNGFVIRDDDEDVESDVQQNWSDCSTLWSAGRRSVGGHGRVVIGQLLVDVAAAVDGKVGGGLQGLTRRGGSTALVRAKTTAVRRSVDDVDAFGWHDVDDGMGSPNVSSSSRPMSVDCAVDEIDDGSNWTSCPPSKMKSIGLSLDFDDDVQREPAKPAERVADVDGQVTVDLLDLDRLMSVSVDYWLRPRLPTEDVIFADVHWEVIKRIIPAYDRFVHLGTAINRSLNAEYETWIRHIQDPKAVPRWIQTKVIPAYTILSVTYCKGLPGFANFDAEDQITIVRLGQSSSRILVAALHWFDSDKHNFRHFLSWRRSPVDGEPSSSFDLFKHQLVLFSEAILREDLDQIEAALLNVLLITGADFPNLRRPELIEETRRKILSTFRAYTTAKYGTPNRRLETLFRYVPNARRLGLLHYMMTTTQTMTAEEVENRLMSIEHVVAENAD